VCDFYVPIVFVILYIDKDAGTKIIFCRPFLASAGYKIDVKEGRLTVDIVEHHVEFSLFKDLESSLSTHRCYGCELVVSNKHVI